MIDWIALHAIAVIATAASLVACAVLVLAERRAQRGLRIRAKLCASLAFLAVGIDAATGATKLYPVPAGWHAYTGWIVVGLAFGVVGDLALLGASKRAFLAGLGAFLIGHLAYVVGLAQLLPPSAWPGHAGIATAAPIAAGALALIWLWRHLGSMRVPVIGYVLAISSLVVGAIAVARSDALPACNRGVLGAGAVLFFASDLAVARERFVVKAFTNKAWGLPAYYAGQLLIAWSIAIR